MTAGGRPGIVRRALTRLRTRAALGLGHAVAPLSVFVPLGAALGPAGTGLIGTDALAHLDIAVSVALAMLGVLIGIASVHEVPGAGRVLLAASVESLATLAVVASAAFVLMTAWDLPVGSPLAAALLLGLCASVSAGPPGELEFAPREVSPARVADLDDVAPLLAGFAIVTALAAPPGRAWEHALLAGLAAAGLGVAGWLLFEHTPEAGERGVFVLGVLALLGGGATALGAPALVCGLIAGALWAVLPGRAPVRVAEDLRRFHEPLVVLLLLVAGALWQPSRAALWLAVPFVLFRLAGKSIGGWVAARAVSTLRAGETGLSLVWPGVVGLAFALNGWQLLPERLGEPLLSAVVLGTVVSEGLALVVIAPDADS